MKRLFITVLCLSVLFVPIQLQAFDDLDGRTTVPIVEEVDLKLDGSITQQVVNFSADFDYIMRLIFHLDFQDAAFLMSEFGKGTALTNGTQIFSEGSDLLGFNITKNEDFFRFAYDTQVIEDDAAPKAVHIYSRFSFFKFSPNGLRYSSVLSLQLKINDDLTAAGLGLADFAVVAEGFSFETEQGAITPKVLSPFDYLNSWAIFLISEPFLWFVLLAGIAVFVGLWKKLK